MKLPIRLLLSLWLVLQMPALCRADDLQPPMPALDRLTLKQAELLLAARNRELSIAQQGVAAAQADRMTAALRPSPNLYLNTFGWNSGPGLGSGNLADKRLDSQIGVSELFERGGKRALRTEIADLNIQAAQHDYADTTRQQKAALYDTYYDVLASQQRLDIAQQNAQAFQKTVDAAQLRLNAGDISGAEVARIEVDALHAQNDARAAQADLEKARIALAYLLGVENSAAQIHVVDDWASVVNADTNADIDAMVQARADVRSAQARLQVAQKARDLARAARSRDITGMVQFEHYPGDFTNNTWGVGVSIPLTGDYVYEGQIRHAESDLTIAQENYDRTVALARGEIESGRADLQAARENVARFNGDLLTQARKAADGAEFAYNRGAMNVMDLLDARRQFYATQLEAVASQADYAKALAHWRLTIPAPTSPPEN